MTKAASQKTGIETRYPIQLIAYASGKRVSRFKIPCAIDKVPFDSSRAIPIIVPKRISNPMFWIMFPNPFWISIIISIGLIPRSMANKKDALNKTKKG